MFAGRLFTSSSTGVVGIDYGSRSIKMLQVRERAGRIDVIGASRIDASLSHIESIADVNSLHGNASEFDGSAEPARREVDAATSLGEQIRAAFIAGGFSGARCVVSLPREDVHLQSIRLPRMPDDELRQTALWEASQRFGLDRAAMEVDFIRTGATLAAASSENREEVILIAVSHAAIYARVEPVLAAGLRPIAVEPGFSALVRTFCRQARREADRSNVRAIVEVGESGSTVLILRGDQIAFCKPIAIGGRHFNNAVAEHLQMDEVQAADLRATRIARERDQKGESDPATDRAVYESVRPLMGDLVKEVMLCLRYYGVTFRGHPPDRIILTGGDGLEPKLGDVMANACKAPVVFDEPSQLLASTLPAIRASLNRSTGPAASWAVALGLSMRGFSKRRSRVEADSAKALESAASVGARNTSSNELKRSAAA